MAASDPLDREPRGGDGDGGTDGEGQSTAGAPVDGAAEGAVTSAETPAPAIGRASIPLQRAGAKAWAKGSKTSFKATAAGPTGPPDNGTAGPAKATKKWPRWAKILTTVGIVLVVLTGATVAAAAVLYKRWTKSIPQAQLLPNDSNQQPQGKVAIQGAFNLLMVGIDDREGVPGWGSRSDSIIIVHVNADHSQIYLASIPRDSVVEIPPFPAANYPGSGGKLKINSAYQIGNRNSLGRSGGVQLLALTIEKLTGITFNGAAIVNFQGFKSLVEALGGVDMCVDEKVTSVHIGFRSNGEMASPFILSQDGGIVRQLSGVYPQVYNVGCQHLKPWQALDYVRQRDKLANGDGDYGRERHQQQFITAIMKQALAKDVLTDPIKLDRVIKAAGDALTIDLHGTSMLDWIFTLKDVIKKDPITMRTNAGKYNAYTVNGAYRGETISEDSLKMFEAIKNDTIDQFLIEHPDFSSAAPLPTFS